MVETGHNRGANASRRIRDWFIVMHRRNAAAQRGRFDGADRTMIDLIIE
jgi:hypothetical protein